MSGVDAKPALAAQTSTSRKRAFDFFAITLFTALSYYVGALFGLALLDEAGGVAIFWPASGVASGLLLVFGRKGVAPIAAGVETATIAGNLVGGRPVVLSLVFAFANTLECLTIAWLVHRHVSSEWRLDSLPRVIGVFLAAIAGSAAGAAVAAGALFFFDASKNSFLTNWRLWLTSDVIGIVALTPLASGLRALLTSRTSIPNDIEGVVMVSLASAAAFAITPSGFDVSGIVYQVPIALLFPPLLLLAIRQPLTYSPIGVSIVALILLATFMEDPQRMTPMNVLFAQLTIFSVIGCSLSVSALIAELRAGEHRQALMVRELDHRVKNALTLVQAVVERSRDSASSAEDFYAALGGRIRSMARTHSLLSRERWKGVPLAELVLAELAPYQDPNADTVRGPAVALHPSLAQSMSLVLHELSTNAAKHGALSEASGRVVVAWSVERNQVTGNDDLVIQWREIRDTPLQKIGPQGFGTSTIRSLLPYEVGAEVFLTFPPDGARCVIRFPVSEGVVLP